MSPGLSPIPLYFVLVLLLLAGMLGVSFALGQRHQDPPSRPPYEVGVVSEESPGVTLSSRFYLVAMCLVSRKPRLSSPWPMDSRKRPTSRYL
jgi:NADH-quinone oxidoreductase subunit A